MHKGVSDDFVVVPFEGKSAQEIYMQLIENINKLYKNPKEVHSTIENTSISVFAMGCDIAYDKILGITRSGCGTYTIKISIKDNRIKYISRLFCKFAPIKQIRYEKGINNHIV